MSHPSTEDQVLFKDAVSGLEAGDFSRLEPLFVETDGRPAQIIRWCDSSLFDDQPRALAEALTCACFLGHLKVVDYLLAKGIDPLKGAGTGLNAFHWAANRGQREVVDRLIERQAPLETRSMYDGTVLGTAVWSAIYETRPDHLRIIEALIKAGARIDDVGYPTGNEDVDEVFRRFEANR